MAKGQPQAFRVAAFFLLMPMLLAHAAACCAETKRGIAGGQSARENATNARWLYNWKDDPSSVTGLVAGDFHGEYVPMIWKSNPGGVQSRINNILGYKDQYNVEYVLGFNEPERTDQSNMTVTQAIDTWDVMTDGFAGSGIKLVSPAVSGNGGVNNWLVPFMTEVNNRNGDVDPNNDLQVDAIAFHWYSTGGNPVSSANTILNKIDSLWADYGRPIWLTEFAGVDFSGNTPTATKVQFNNEFLEYIIPRLESRAHVERYSWYQFGVAGHPYSQLTSNSGGVYTPTTIGDEYVGTLQVGDSYDFASGEKPATDVHYLRGGTLTHSGTALPVALRAIDALEDVGTISGQADWGLSGGSDSFMRIRTGATLQKTGTNTVTVEGAPVSNSGTLSATAGTLVFRDAAIENDGILRANGGAVRFENGTQVTGTGAIHLDGGGTLSLGAATDTSGSVIAHPLLLQGGTLESNPITSGSHVISGTTTAHSTTTLSGAGDLFITGAIVAPAGGGGGGIIKEGTGTVLINGNNTYTGDTVVNQGTLRFGFAGAINSSPNVTVGPDGVLDVLSKSGGLTLNGQNLSVQGQVAGSINATAGSTVEVLSSTSSISGNLTVSGSTVRVGGSGFNEGGSAAPPIVSTGLQLNFDAALDTPGNSTWTNAADPGSDVTFASSASPVVVSDSSVLGVTAAYDISTSGEATGLINYFGLQAPPRSQKDATFEVVFHVSDTAAGADQVLLKAGSTRGVSLTLSDDSLSLNVAGDGAVSALSTTLGTGWHHAVGVIDLVGTDDNLANDSLELFVDNVSVGKLNNVLIDSWTNGAPVGIGGDAFGTVGTSSPIDYHAEIASARYYEDVLFTASDVAQNYSHMLGVGVRQATTMQVAGDYTQLTDGTLELDLLSPTMHDVLDITGSASLSGSLDVSAIAGFDPDLGDAFTILLAAGGITGQFETTLLPSLAMGKFFVLDYHATEVVLSVAGLTADFDLDGDVDASDLASWQNTYGNGLDGLDFLNWQREFTGLSNLNAAANSVPEPATIGLIVLAAALLCGRQSRRRG